jgi:Putative peptidoglycan binding domain
VTSPKVWAALGAAVVTAIAGATAAVVLTSSGNAATSSAQAPAATAAVEKGRLSDVVSQFGTLAYRARSDGSPYSVTNQSGGIYTKLPDAGERARCGDALYRVDDKPVLLLCGSTPAYRSLAEGDSGRDVAELNANLVELGYTTRARLEPSPDRFGAETAAALSRLQRAAGAEPAGSLDLGDAVFLPGPVRIAHVRGELGGMAPPGAQVMDATSATLEVQVALDPSHEGAVEKGDPARITLPGNRSVTGKVERVGNVAVPAGQDTNAGAASIPLSIALDDPQSARGLDWAPVQVEITTAGVASALSVPVTALVGMPGGGLAVELERPGGRRELIAVKLGLFDTADGRVQVDGRLREGDRVVVPPA